jgi:transcriptional regulator with XRE-family HTH domain
MQPPPEYGTLIREARRRKRLSLRRTADALGISAGYLADVEVGRSGPLAPETTVEAARLLEIDRDTLLFAAVWVRAGSWCSLLAEQD